MAARRSIVRFTSVALSLGLILAFAISAASADLAGCRNCVEKGDIRPNAVDSSRIKNNSVSSKDIRNRTIRVGDMHASAVSAVGSVLLNQEAFTNSITGAEMDRFSVAAPGTGYLVVEVTGKFYFEMGALSADGLTKQAGALALCTSPNAVSGSACGASTEEGIVYADADSTHDWHQTPFFTLSRVIPVRRGTTTMYLNGRAADPGEGLSLFGPVRATAMFVPNALRVTT